MLSIVNGYMDAIERENDMFNRSIEIESNKISLMVEAYYNKLENDYLLAEQKVMMENGTYDDLTYLYTEANEEADKNKETIFQKIKAFFQRIFDSIKNLFRRGDAYEGDAPKCFMDAANGSGSSEIVNFFKKVGNDFKNGNVIDAIETLGKGGLTAFSVCVAIDKGVESASNVIHYPKKAYLKVKDWFNRLTSELERIESELIDAAQASKNEKATSFANAVKAKLGKLILTVKGWWQKFVSFITDVKDKITGKNNEEENQEQQPGSSETPTDGNKRKISGATTASGVKYKGNTKFSTKSSNNSTDGDSSTQDDSTDSDKRKISGATTASGVKYKGNTKFSTKSSNNSTDGDSSTQDDSGDNGSGNDNPKYSANAEKAMPAMKKQCQKIISTLKNYNDTLDNNDKKRIKDINKLMVNYDQKKVDPYKAFSMLYDGLDELLDILKKVGTKKQIRSCTMSTKDFKDKYVFSNDEGVIIKESYFDFDDDYDLYDEYTEIDSYDYDEINRIFTEYTGDPLVDELLDILDEF